MLNNQGSWRLCIILLSSVLLVGVGGFMSNYLFTFSLSTVTPLRGVVKARGWIPKSRERWKVESLSWLMHSAACYRLTSQNTYIYMCTVHNQLGCCMLVRRMSTQLTPPPDQFWLCTVAGVKAFLSSGVTSMCVQLASEAGLTKKIISRFLPKLCK